ncbi:hypothetical protein [Pseudomonas gorinensis]
MNTLRQTKTPPIISDDRRRFLGVDQKSHRVLTMKLRGSPYKLGVFGAAHAGRKFISNKLHLNQHIADFSYMMRPTPKVKGD